MSKYQEDVFKYIGLPGVPKILTHTKANLIRKYNTAHQMHLQKAWVTIADQGEIHYGSTLSLIQNRGSTGQPPLLKMCSSNCVTFQ